MAATVGSVGTAAEGAETVSCPPPASIANGDLLIGFVAGLYQDITSNASLSGWTHKLSFVTNETRLSILYKYASGESGNYVFTMTGALFSSGVVLRVIDAVTAGDPFSDIGSGSSGTSSTATAASISPADTDTLLLAAYTWVNGGTSISGDPSGMTEQVAATILGIFSQANASSGATGTRAATLSGSEDWGAILMAITSAGGGDPAPSITDVDEDDTITLTQANVEIDGTDFDTATVEIRQGAYTYTPSIDSQSGTAIQFDMEDVGGAGPITAPKHGSATLAVVNGDDQEDTISITITPVAGSDYVDVGTPNADPDLRLTGTPDVESGDQVRWLNVQGTGVDETDIVVNNDLTWEADEAVTSFDFQVWDAGDGTWGDAATQHTGEEVEEPVLVPDVVGDDQATATSTLEGAGFVVSVSNAYSESVAAGDVISQDPEGDTEAEEGSTVFIVVSLGEAPASDSSDPRGNRRRGRTLVTFGR